MTTTPNYNFAVGATSYSGTITSQPGPIDTGTSSVTGHVTKSGVAVFQGAPGTAISGQLEVMSNLSLDNFASIDVTDLQAGGTVQVFADNVGYLNLTGAVADTVAVTATGTGSAYFSGLARGVYAIENGAHNIEFDKVGTAYVHGTGSGAASDSANVTEDTQTTSTVLANLGRATLNLASPATATPDLVDASDIGTLNLSGTFQGGVKIYADNIGTVDVSDGTTVSFIDLAPSKDLMLNVSGNLNFAGGNFTLMGGNETVNVTQGLATPQLQSGNSAFIFDLKGSTATGPGDTITFNQYGNAGNNGSGAHDATFMLGAGSANITVDGQTNTYNGWSRVAFIGGAGEATIHGGTGGSDVTFGTGTMDVTGGRDPNGLAHNDYTFGAYGTSTTLDTIEDFKVGTDVLNLSSTVESHTTFTDTQGGTAITFGHHTIDVVGVHITAANVTWTH